ncbi:MAG: hypothetical protein UHG68_02850, partial [Clostridia bacterium]|nr:hypothetical protein [Clostridia bacterium]
MIHEINLEIDKPDVYQALRQLEFFIANVRVSKGKVIKTIKRCQINTVHKNNKNDNVFIITKTPGKS